MNASVFSGKVISIHTAESEGGALVSHGKVEAIAGCGLKGDRYFRSKEGERKPHRNVSLIELESIQALTEEKGIEIEPHEARRNIVTQGVPLNHLVGRIFRIGKVRLKGGKLCEPCNYLEEKTAKGVKDGLIHRGGLRAEILNDGVIQVDADIMPENE